MSKQQKPSLPPHSISDYGPSPTKSQIQMRRQKKKKMNAFKTFLNKIEPEDNSDPLAKRKHSGDLNEEKLQMDPLCKICNQMYGEKGKDCLFCHEKVCVSHIRKKRRDPDSNKFARICDLCEDVYLYRKHLKTEMKIQQTLVAQQFLLETKLQELKDLLDSKKIKLTVLKNRAAELQTDRKRHTQRYNTSVNDYQRRSRKIEERTCENIKLEKELAALEKKMPPSLQADYQFLVEENDRIMKDLVKHEKLCNDVVKARSQREKAMYNEYYEWQLMEKNRRSMGEEEKEECAIY